MKRIKKLHKLTRNNGGYISLRSFARECLDYDNSDEQKLASIWFANKKGASK